MGALGSTLQRQRSAVLAVFGPCPRRAGQPDEPLHIHTDVQPKPVRPGQHHHARTGPRPRIPHGAWTQQPDPVSPRHRPYLPHGQHRAGRVRGGYGVCRRAAASGWRAFHRCCLQARTSNAGPAAARRTCACATKTATVRSGSPASSPPPRATTARALPVRSVLPARGTTNAAPISASRTPAYAATTATARQARSAGRRSPGRTDAKRRPTVASFRCKRCAPGMPSAARTSASPTGACATATAIARLGRSATGRWGRRTRAAWSG